jgi:hypothetical protein
MYWNEGLVLKHWSCVVFHPSCAGYVGSSDVVMAMARASVLGQPRPQFVQAKACVHVGGLRKRRPIQTGVVAAAEQSAVRPASGAEITFVLWRTVICVLVSVVANV